MGRLIQGTEHLSGSKVLAPQIAEKHQGLEAGAEVHWARWHQRRQCLQNFYMRNEEDEDENEINTRTVGQALGLGYLMPPGECSLPR